MSPYRKNSGFSLIEVLVTIVILSIGLLGLAGLQARALTAQMESYQRSQALVLIKDMVDRIDANRAAASSYVTTSPLGTGGTGAQTAAYCAGLATLQARDFCEWNNALLGTAEAQSGVGNVGAMVGARGCIYQLQAPAVGVPSVYQVAVAWQGMNPTKAPDTSTPTSVNSTSAGRCGVGLYMDRTGAVKEELHRVISMSVSVGDLN